MTGKVFVDSNVLIYLFSVSEEAKRNHCEWLLSEWLSPNQLVWSTQVVQEFYNTMTKKFKMDELKAKSLFDYFAKWELVTNDLTTIKKAIDIQILNQLSFWDSLIISAAVQAKCKYLITEDLNHGQAIAGVEVVSPFKIAGS